MGKTAKKERGSFVADGAGCTVLGSVDPRIPEKSLVKRALVP